MVKTNNPAGRLLQILEQFSEQRRDAFNSRSNRDAWKNILELETENDTEIFQAVLCVNELVRDTKVMIGSAAPNPQLYLKCFDKIEKAVFPRELDKDFDVSMRLIDDAVLQSLQFSCELLSSFYDEGDVTKEELSSILDDVEALFEQTHSSGLDNDVKTFILESLEAIRRSISHYKIYGAKGLRSAFQLTLGGVVANKEELSSSKENAPTLLKNIGTLLTKLDSATAMAFKAKKVLSNSLSLLGFDEDK